MSPPVALSQKIPFSASRYDRITSLLTRLHWLKVPEHIKFKLAVLIYGCLHQTAPSPMQKKRRYLAQLPTLTYLQASSREAGAAVELAASNKVVKYAGLSSQGEFVPTAVESHGPINRDAVQFLSKLGRRLAETTGDVRASSFLFQRFSVVAQRFNSVLLHDGFIDDDRPE